MIHHLLHPDERLLVACFEELGRFRRSCDPAILNGLQERFASRCGSEADELISQALLVDRLFALTGMLALQGDSSDYAAAAVPQEALRLLAIIEAAQTSRVQLEALLNGDDRLDPGGMALFSRFAALLLSCVLLSCGLRLPARGQHRAACVRERSKCGA
jgi:hypothetical protein